MVDDHVNNHAGCEVRSIAIERTSYLAVYAITEHIRFTLCVLLDAFYFAQRRAYTLYTLYCILYT